MRKLMTCCLDLALALGVTAGVALTARTLESEFGRWSPLMVWDAADDGPELASVRDGGERSW